MYMLWAIWPWLSTLNRMFVLILTAVSVYSVVFAIALAKRTHDLKKCNNEEGGGPIRYRISVLQKHCANMRQSLTATFYLFGLVFFLGLQNAPTTVGDGTGILSSEILNNFIFDFVFAANVFAVFFVLHLIQWLTSSRLQRCAIHLEKLI
jgi:hypothetical protein